NSLGYGAGLLRFMEFNSALSDEKSNRLTLDYWSKVTSDFFSPTSVCKLTLWKDNERREAKPFEITANVLAMLLHVSCQSGVRSMNFMLEGLVERYLGSGTAIIECPQAQWLWRFHDGHVVSLRGNFSCQVSAYCNPSGAPDQQYFLKFDTMTFDSNSHEKMILLDSIRGTRLPENVQKTPATTTQGSPEGSSSSKASAIVKSEEAPERQLDTERIVIDHAILPSEPINAFGIPQASMRCLEVSGHVIVLILDADCSLQLAESVGQMTELFQYCHSNNIGPQGSNTLYCISIPD
ncbi:hypothetical protein M422DRAFT_150091, partial [Sphaerobolus stellatus SS14]